MLVAHQRVLPSQINPRTDPPRIGFVGQEPILFNTTVRANLLYGIDEAVDTHVTDEYLRKCLGLVGSLGWV